MCGIVGMSFRCAVSSRKHKMDTIKKMFTDMLVSAQGRGSAATGIAMMTCATDADKNKKTRAWVLRSPLPASEFVETDDYKDIMDKVDTNCLSIIGHTRAVAGNNAVAENNRNNHPHVHNNIIGIHNGRITNDHELWKKYEKFMKPKGMCDSEVIIAMVEHFLTSGAAVDTEEAIEMALSQSDAWYALAFLDTKNPNKLYLVKDSATPLSLGWWNGPEVALFASNWSYITQAHDKHSNLTKSITALKQCDVTANQIVTLDSTVRGDSWTELFTGRRTIRNAVDVDAIIAANSKEFNTTQGK